jgi:hypothetical protein
MPIETDTEEDFSDQGSVFAQARSWAPLTPSDDEDLPFPPKAIHNASAVAGSFTAVGSDNVEATFYMQAGGILPIRPKRIKSAGLTGGMVLTGLKT